MNKTVKPSDLILGALATILLWWGLGGRAALVAIAVTAAVILGRAFLVGMRDDD